MGWAKNATESAGTSLKDRAALERDRHAVVQRDEIIRLLTRIVELAEADTQHAPQRRT